VTRAAGPAAGTAAGDRAELAADVALACRILARTGLASASLGHVSARHGPDRIVVRCRGPHDSGLLFTGPDAIRPVNLDDPRSDGGWALPHELPIHTEIYRARPEVGSVVHVHAPAAVLCGLAGLELRPVFGAFDIPAARLALAGVPVFGRAALITRPELGAELVAAMAGRDACLMRGHGITAVGPTVAAATVRALNLEQLARITVELARLGARPEPLSSQDRAELPDLGTAFNDGLVWRHHEHLDATANAQNRSTAWAVSTDG
jgi:ribulose-5-phosphate 4-epimerase/fuculose-1-phosphate aldolase